MMAVCRERNMWCLFWLYMAATLLDPSESTNRPTYNLDSYTAILSLDLNMSELVELQNWTIKDLPDECRQDKCETSKTVNKRLGLITWPSASVGMRHYERCEYAHDILAYAHRDCLPVNHTHSLWSPANLTECPEPLMHIILQEHIQNKSILKCGSTGLLENSMQTIIQSIYNVSVRHPSDPVFSEDILIILNFMEMYFSDPACLNASMDVDLVKILAIVDHVLKSDSNYWKSVHHDTRPRFLQLLGEIVQQHTLYKTSPQDMENLELNIALAEEGTLASFQISFEDNSVEKTWYVQIEASFNETNVTMTILVVRDSQAIRDGSYSYLSTPNDLDPDGSAVRFKRSLSLKSLLSGQSGMDLLASASNDDLDQIASGGHEPIEFGLFIHNISADEEPINGSDVRNAGSRNPNSVSRKTLVNMVGPVVFVATDSIHENIINGLNLTFNLNVSAFTVIKDTENLVCGNLQQDGLSQFDGSGALYWTIDRCETEIQSDIVICRCTTAGYFALFGRTDTKDTDMEREKPGVGLAELLGFPYHYELYIVSQVLMAISLACLLATIISFVIFRHARRGTSTLILLNLCTALIVLILVLYISNTIAHTKYGCFASNLLRYYLIFVSLLWNGVEAVNMYLMLIKVFNSDVSRFTTKAGFVAWGSPLVAIAVYLAINATAFEGYYKECIFRCQLKESILYYGLLVPMGVIMFFNLIIFGMVLRVIIHHGNLKQRGKRGVWLKRVVGAVAMLVLLGLPWIFGAFGAIDHNSSRELELLEGIFQVLFVVLVNAQGIFIFVFHCARNNEMRKQWTLSLSKMSFKELTIATHKDDLPGSENKLRNNSETVESYKQNDTADTRI